MRYQFLLALGRPREIIALEGIGPDGDIKCYRNEAGVHHIPEGSLQEPVR